MKYILKPIGHFISMWLQITVLLLILILFFLSFVIYYIVYFIWNLKFGMNIREFWMLIADPFVRTDVILEDIDKFKENILNLYRKIK